MNNIKYRIVMICLILSYGLCAFANETEQERNAKALESSIDLATVSELMPDKETDPAFQDFDPDYIFSEKEESLLDKDIGNY